MVRHSLIYLIWLNVIIISLQFNLIVLRVDRMFGNAISKKEKQFQLKSF